MKEHHQNSDNAQKEKEIADLARYLEENSLTIEEYLSEDEWNRFLESKDNMQKEHAAEESYGPVYKATLRKSKIKKNIYTGMKLAVFLAICASAWFLLDVNSYFAKSPATARIVYQHTNTSGFDEKITLPDGSRIMLQAGSAISYREGFNTSRRDLYLTGSAVFVVEKNDRAPFTVYCGSIATTALGTIFSVDGRPENPVVHLYEGKVVVKGIKDTTVRSYLFPGETVAYLASENIFKPVIQTAAKNPVKEKTNGAATPKKTPKEASAAPVETHDPATSRSYLNFQNKKLSTIFDYLADRYDVEIRYPTDVALSTNVLLSVDADQPVGKILENICRTSGLTANKLDDRTYLITK